MRWLNRPSTLRMAALLVDEEAATASCIRSKSYRHIAGASMMLVRLPHGVL